MFEGYKKGVELFAIGIALVSASIAGFRFLTTEANSMTEVIMTAIIFITILSPIFIVGADSILTGMKSLYPDRPIIFKLFFIGVVFMAISWTIGAIFGDLNYFDNDDDEPKGIPTLSYGVHSLHYYDHPEAWKTVQNPEQ